MGATAAVVGAVAATASAANSIAKGSSGAGGGANAAGQQAADYRQQAADLWRNLSLPQLDKTPLVQQSWLQDFNPETYQPYIGQLSQMSDDQKALDSENQSLGQLQQLARGGLQPADMIALNQIRNQEAGAATSNASAAADALRNRGLGGAGAEYAARLSANQGAANTASGLYDNAMKAAMDRQTAAITASGSLAGNIRQQSDNVSKQMADINNAFNTQIQNLRTAAASNAANVRNQAQAANLAGRQNVANSNVGTQNQNVALQNALMQQNFGNQTTQIAGETNALNNQAALASANQAALSRQALGADQSLSTGLSGLANIAKSVSNDGSSSGSPSAVGKFFGDLFPSSADNASNNIVNPDGSYVVPPIPPEFE